MPSPTAGRTARRISIRKRAPFSKDAAVPIGPPVEVRRQEGADQVTVTAMDLHEVESRGLARAGRRREVTHDLGDLVDAEGLEWARPSRCHPDCSGHRRQHPRAKAARYRRPACHRPRAGCRTSCRTVHGIDELPRAQELPVVVDAASGMLARNRGRHDGRGTDRHQARSGPGALDEVGDHFGVGLGIAVEHHAGRHSGQHDPVGDAHPANADRREEL